MFNLFFIWIQVYKANVQMDFLRALEVPKVRWLFALIPVPAACCITWSQISWGSAWQPAEWWKIGGQRKNHQLVENYSKRWVFYTRYEQKYKTWKFQRIHKIWKDYLTIWNRHRETKKQSKRPVMLGPNPRAPPKHLGQWLKSYLERMLELKNRVGLHGSPKLDLELCPNSWGLDI